MTKYVLNSGGIGRFPELKRRFHQELVKSLGESPEFLICSFAQPREDWESRFQGYSDSISEDMAEGVKPTFTLAMPDSFIEQCKKADIIYFNGGDDHLVQYWMSKYNLLELFKNKVVATNSASSNMLSTHYWTCDWRQCGDGLAVLPIKFIPHYQSDFGDSDPRGSIDWEKAYKDLAVYGDASLPIHTLEEGSFIVFENETLI